MQESAMSLSKKLSELDERVLPLNEIDQAAVAVGKRVSLRRSATDRHIAGICGGVAAHYGLDARIVRLCFLLFAPFTAWVYSAMWVLVPVGPDPPLQTR